MNVDFSVHYFITPPPSGILTRPAAFPVVINMLVATALTLPGGFLVPNGASYPFIFLVIAVVILLAGPMAYSLDSFISKRKRTRTSNEGWNRIRLIKVAA